ncbi:helix-turn-helix domain-containing protein [Streptomyces scabiei]|uniref:helix-turn-helix domain-containing protein n=1 Tax=Streptomyces scabiei TaxID=1930 RepID=UPI00340F94EA
MTATHPRNKANAVLWLAAGKSQRAAAAAAGVSPGTVSQWLRNRVFAEEVERMRTVWAEKSKDGQALLDHLEEVERRLTPSPTVRVEGGGSRVVVSIPASASPARRRRLLARGIAKAMDSGDGR